MPDRNLGGLNFSPGSDNDDEDDDDYNTDDTLPPQVPNQLVPNQVANPSLAEDVDAMIKELSRSVASIDMS